MLRAQEAEVRMRAIRLILAIALTLLALPALAQPPGYADRARKLIDSYVQSGRFSGSLLPKSLMRPITTSISR